MAVFPLLALPPEERRAFELCVSVELVPPERWVRFPASRLRSRRLTEPPRPMRRGAYPQSCAKAHDSSFCGRAKGGASVDAGFRLCGGEAVDGARLAAFRSPPPPLRAPAYRLVSEINVGRSRRLCQPPRPQPRLSKTRPPLRRNQLRRKAQLKRQPLFGRGGLGERRFSQRSGLSPRIFLP